jgi:hypothetical protein
MSGHKSWSGISHKGQELKLDPALNRTVRFPVRVKVGWFKRLLAAWAVWHRRLR